jgi:hypothetical protein
MQAYIGNRCLGGWGGRRSLIHEVHRLGTIAQSIIVHDLVMRSNPGSYDSSSQQHIVNMLLPMSSIFVPYFMVFGNAIGMFDKLQTSNECITGRRSFVWDYKHYGPLEYIYGCCTQLLCVPVFWQKYIYVINTRASLCEVHLYTYQYLAHYVLKDVSKLLLSMHLTLRFVTKEGCELKRVVLNTWRVSPDKKI